MEVSVQKRFLERLHFDAAHGSYSILVWSGPDGRTPYEVVKPGPVKHRVEICPEGYIVVIPR
ncbi:hypothetical protein K8353_31820 [Burkholderia contaminans]|nr:hypothetical protein [Burkholderia contaminans]